jgi:hypothetical protein
MHAGGFDVGILATETILQLKLRVQLVGSRAAGTWIYRGLIPALLKQLNSIKCNQFRYATTFSSFENHKSVLLTSGRVPG